MAKRGASTDLQIFGSEKVLLKLHQKFSINRVFMRFRNPGYNWPILKDSTNGRDFKDDPTDDRV